ncbi:MAG: polysaccharide biosynthesis/export family protein [Bacteroidales bacterium]|nr:polysaccharide biosynthesis/export family protein [Bacteroidales bacterium]
MKKRLAVVFAAFVTIWALSSCSSTTYKNINYLQDIQNDTTWATVVNNGIVIKPKDQLSIVVSCREPQIAAQFNLSTASYQAGSEITSTTGGGSYRILGYVVDNFGDIDFPVLGKLHVAGLTRFEVSDLVKGRLAADGYLTESVVTVEFMNFKVSVMGEVQSPGTYTVSTDKINVLQALSLAKDLTIYGCRDNVTVIREQDGQHQVFKMDLRSKDFFNSPAFYLQQNDVIYVYPSKVRAGQSTVNENNLRSVSFWISIGSFMMTAANVLATVLSNTAK